MTILEQRLQIQRILSEVAEELHSAQAKHAPMHSAHEGWATLTEEVEELWGEVKMQHQNPEAMRQEALQVAAMAVRFILDVCDKGVPDGQ